MLQRLVGPSQELTLWVKFVAVHFNYNLQLVNRLHELNGITEKIADYSQRSKSEEATEKMQGMNLQRDLSKTDYCLLAFEWHKGAVIRKRLAIYGIVAVLAASNMDQRSLVDSKWDLFGSQKRHSCIRKF